jgi:type IV pilus assembly protein PilV
MHLSYRVYSRGRARVPASKGVAGFSLIEVMVALVVCAIGLLGLAKMESLALSSTNIAGSRSIAAIQAASLAAAMHANPGYWANGFAPASFTVSYSGTTPLISDAGLATVPAAPCTTAGTTSCLPPVMAAYDVQAWASALYAVLPAYFATVTCYTGGFPVTCTITIQWTENAVASNAQQTNMANISNVGAGSSANAQSLPTYTLFVQP